MSHRQGRSSVCYYRSDGGETDSIRPAPLSVTGDQLHRSASTSCWSEMRTRGISAMRRLTAGEALSAYSYREPLHPSLPVVATSMSEASSGKAQVHATVSGRNIRLRLRQRHYRCHDVRVGSLQRRQKHDAGGSSVTLRPEFCACAAACPSEYLLLEISDL